MTSEAVLVGIDIGTQSLKAVVTTERLEVIGEAAVAYRPSFPRPGWAEQDPALWTGALAAAIGGALEAAGARADQVRAIGVAGQLDGCVPVGADGTPLGPCLIWMDRRADDCLPELDRAAFSAATGQVLDASHLAAKARWLDRHRPGAARFHQPVGFVVEQLTGEAVIDPALASTTNLHDLAAGAWSPSLLAAFELDAARLPRIAAATEIAGRLHARGAALTGLPAGVPVAVGTGDDFATALGAGVIASGPVLCVLGTAEVVGALADRAIVDSGGLVETHVYPAGGWLVENPGWLAGGALAWLCDVWRIRDAATVDALAESTPTGADGVLFLPALSGAMAPEWNAAARAALTGLTPAHGTGHVARAVLEGCAHAMRDVVDRLASLGVATTSLRLAGGGAKSHTWAQIRADLSGLPVERAYHADPCPVGAAMLAAVAAGVVPDLAAAAAAIPPPVPFAEPRPSHQAAADDAYRQYRRLYEALRPTFS